MEWLYYFVTPALAQFDDNYPDVSNTGESSCSQIQTFADLLQCGTNAVITPLIYLISAVALLVFLWGVFQYIKEAGNDAKRAEASKMILYGLIGLFVMVSVWGLVYVIKNTFPLKDDYKPSIQLPI